MKQFLTHILCLTALCLVLSNCKHEQPTEPAAACQYDSSVEEMKKWYYFKIGTWWVYQEETTGALDTVTVYHNWDGINTGGFEGFEWHGASSFDGYNYYYSFNTSYSIYCLSKHECTCHKVKRVKTKPGDYVGESWLFLYPVIRWNFNNLIGFPNGQITGGTSTVTDINLLAYTINDTLSNVARWEVTTDQSISGWPSVYYFKDEIGIVSMEFPHSNQKWNLIEYNILQ